MTRRLLKKASYYTGGDRTAYVAYIILGDECTYTACQQGFYGSTINYAEDIVESICKQENRDYRALKFFDLQTGTGYSGYHYDVPGTFEYDQVTFSESKNSPVIKNWIPAFCPDKIVILFRDFIGEEPKQVRPNGELFIAKRFSGSTIKPL